MTKGGAATCEARTGHLSGPLFVWSRNLGILYGPFPFRDMWHAPFHKFLVPCRGFFFGFLCILEVAYLNCHPSLPVFNHFCLVFIPLFSPPWGSQEGRGDVAILIYLHHGDLGKAGVM